MKLLISGKNILQLFGCMVLLANTLATHAKCPYSPVTFWATYVDSGYLFANSGRVDLPVKFDFGDGQTFYGVKPKNGIFHKYTQNGSYTVTMYYNDTIQYCKDTAVQQVCFFKLGDSVSFRKSNDTLYAAAPCHANAFYRWAFGDNTYGKGCNSWHVYQKSDFYTSQLLFVTDTPSGCPYYYESKYQLMDFTKCGFTSKFYYEKYMGMQPLRLKAIVATGPFIDTKRKQYGRETWYWGDGSSSTQSLIERDRDTHFYSTHGTYNICHVYEDSAQCKDSVCNLVEVDSCNAYTQFTYTANFREVTFDFKAAGNYSWYVDGKKIMLNNGRYTFATNGTYQVCLKSTGLDDCMAEVCSTLSVFKCEPLSLSKVKWVQPKNDCSSYRFTNTNSSYQLFHWDFGDGATSTDNEPFHTYGQDSTYTVMLMAKDSIYGCEDTLVFHLAKYCCNIQDSLKLTKTTQNSAKLENYSYIRNPKGPVHKHQWIFDWTVVSNQAFPTHIYETRGTKYIIYIAYDTVRNCNDTFYLDFKIDSLNHVPFLLNVSNSSAITDSYFGENVLVFPNPARDVVFVSGLHNAEIMGIRLYSLLGLEIPVVWKTEGGACAVNLPSTMPSGVYFIQIRTDKGLLSAKFFKE